MQMMDFVKKNFVPVIITTTILLLLLIIKPNGQEPGDQGIKHIQVLDLIQNKFATIECIYSANEIDPEKKFLPLKETFFVHLIGDKCYYVFPFYFSYILSPLKLFLSNEFEYLIPFLCGVLTIWLFWFWGRELKLSDRNRKLLTFYIGFGTGIFLYCFTLSEISLNFLLVNVSFYLLWKYNHNNRLIFLIVPTMLLAFTVYFRQESLPLALITFACLFLTKNVSMRRLFLIAPIYSLIIFLWLFINFRLFGNPFGLRGIQQSKELVEGSFLLNRIYMYVEIFFYKRDNFGLFIAYPILFLLPFQFKRLKNINPKFLPFLITAIFFTLLIPIATITYQGFNWGTRFLLSMVPILITGSFLLYEECINENPKSKIKYFLSASIAWSILGVLVFLAILRFSHNQMKIVNEFVKNKSEAVIVLLGKGAEGATISSHNQKIVLQAYDKQNLTKVLSLLKQKKIQSFSFSYVGKGYFNEKEFFTDDVMSQLEVIETHNDKGIYIKTVKFK
jgi:hypothetical protein